MTSSPSPAWRRPFETPANEPSPCSPVTTLARSPTSCSDSIACRRDPGLYTELRHAAQSGKSLYEIGQMLEQDVSVTAQLINMANSAFFAFNSPARSASEAVTRLGLNCTTGVVLATEGASNLGPDQRRLVERANQHSIELANLARKVAGEDDRLFLAAVLHDIGQVAMLGALPGQRLRPLSPGDR